MWKIQNQNIDSEEDPFSATPMTSPLRRLSWERAWTVGYLRSYLNAMEQLQCTWMVAMHKETKHKSYNFDLPIYKEIFKKMDEDQYYFVVALQDIIVRSDRVNTSQYFGYFITEQHYYRNI